ncbi:hypothetical protein AB9K21_00630 [Anaplasma phagocytophilum]|uniref:Uncharacterized protein n=2 Tax=Anaplasma phagocytophilum TaxID=948 RepID=A0A0F3NHG7_ANAPH|nr:hypothetical protein APHMUC_0929 [Anaplasma phagocytophilum str. ApMUC09]KJV67211.1 hypothetical protein APHNP_0728 [Anaplasma phagocytophilum str. ApNP]
MRTDARPIAIASMCFVPCAADFRVLIWCATWFMRSGRSSERFCSIAAGMCCCVVRVMAIQS